MPLLHSTPPARRRTGFTAALFLVLGSATGLAVHAQDKYPSRPLTIVVGFGPGSSSDVGVRQMLSKMQPKFGQPVLVENRAGASATIAYAYLAKAKPDGYTIAYVSTSLVLAPGMVKNISFDPVKDFEGITLVGEQYFALLTRGENKGMSLAQFIEGARREPAKYPVGGQAGTTQTLNNMMAEAGKLTHTYVPYAEAGRMMNDLWGGRLAASIVPLNLGLPPQKSGQGHILAVSSAQRLSILPDTPVMQESLPGVNLNIWTGYFAPAKTPRPVINFLHARITEAGKEPEVLQRNSDGGRAIFLTPDETNAYVRKELPRWTALLKAAGIEPE